MECPDVMKHMGQVIQANTIFSVNWPQETFRGYANVSFIIQEGFCTQST